MVKDGCRERRWGRQGVMRQSRMSRSDSNSGALTRRALTSAKRRLSHFLRGCIRYGRDTGGRSVQTVERRTALNSHAKASSEGSCRMVSRTYLVLAAMASGDAPHELSPVQAQKLFFLIDREASGPLNGPLFNFRPYDYGPFDRAVYEEMDQLALHGLVKIEKAGAYRRYVLTERGIQKAQDILPRIPENARTFFAVAGNWVRSLGFRSLVSAIYRAYPETKENSIFQS